MWVKLKGSWQANFRRCVRNEDGEIIDTLHFSPDEPVQVEDEPLYLMAIANSLGHALIPLDIGPNGGFIPVNEPLDIDAMLAAMAEEAANPREGEGDSKQPESKPAASMRPQVQKKPPAEKPSKPAGKGNQITKPPAKTSTEKKPTEPLKVEDHPAAPAGEATATVEATGEVHPAPPLQELLGNQQQQ